MKNKKSHWKLYLYFLALSAGGLLVMAGCSDTENLADVGTDPFFDGGPPTTEDTNNGNGTPSTCDEAGSPFGGGSGDATDPYLHCSPNHLLALSHTEDLLHMGAEHLVTADIDMAGVTDFMPIGDNDPNRFSGDFDGGGHTISNLTIDLEDESYVGLFGYLDQFATVEDVTLEDADITGGSSRVGVLAGYNEGVIINSSSSGVVRGDAGGLVGDNGGEIVDSSSTVDVEGTGRSGGLVSENGSNGTITGSHASGEVEGAHAGGGLAATNWGTISDCYASGFVHAETNHVGGLVGESQGQIEFSHATGDVAGDDTSGGLVGSNPGSVADSYATGNVEADHSIGGLVGRNTGDISRSYSTGTVEGSSGVGGFVGNNSGEVVDSFTTGASQGLSALGSHGGFVGESHGDLINVYAAGPIDGESDDLGGLISRHDEDATVTNSYWDVDTTGLDTSNGGEARDTSDFDDEGNFEGWDFTDVWIIDSAPDGEQRPTLRD